MKALFNYIKGDKVIWVIVLLLSIVSVLAVYSSVEALAFRSHSGNASYYLIKHLIIIMFGFLLIYLTHNLKYTFFSRISQIALYLSVPLLLFTLLKGVNEGNATRWLQIPGTGLTFQTSDFAKLALLIYVARMLAIKQDVLHDFKTGFLPIIIPVIAICGLIFPSNFSTAFLLFVNCMFIMFIGKAKLTHLLLTIGIAISCAGLFILLVFAFPHINNRVATWKSRIESFTKGDKADNYQADQAMIAIATGGPVGKGPVTAHKKHICHRRLPISFLQSLWKSTG